MTNKEILKADYLDILFDNRNKAYGAYALRRNYDKRMRTALGIALSLILIFMLLSSFKKHSSSGTIVSIPGVVMQPVELKHDDVKKKADAKEETHQTKTKTAIQTSTTKFTDNIVFKNNIDHSDVPPADDFDNTDVGDKTSDGKASSNIPQTTNANVNGNSSVKVEKNNDPPIFEGKELPPQFPGGADALTKFLKDNLQSPDGMEPGEIKTVKVKFMVDRDGSITLLEIIQSGGNDFDNEVLRVCRRMPRWQPAVQNGINVPVSFAIPVTFVATE